MKSRLWVALSLAGTTLVSRAHAVDHNNLDAGRPLRFDDAEPIAYREQSLEVGAAFTTPRRRAGGVGLQLEYLYGFALNSHLDLGIDPSIGGRAESGRTGFDVGDASLGVLHSLKREVRNTPALAVRGDVFLPTGRDSKGVDLRLRGIASKTFAQYSRMHLNVDLNISPSRNRGERAIWPALTMGISKPLGYPRRFNRTGLAELSVRSSPRRGEGPLLSLGVGLRQQVTVRSVFDVGIQSDVVNFGDGSRDLVRVVAGYSTGF